MRASSVRLLRRTQSRCAEFRGGSGEPVRILWARLAAPIEGDIAEPLAELALAVVAANDWRIPVAPASKSGEGRRKIRHVGDEGSGQVGGKVCVIISYVAGGRGGQGDGVCHTWAVG